MSDETKALITQAVERHGHVVRGWREDPDDGLIGVLGRFVVIEEDEDAGLYEGDEGDLLAFVVGSPKYGNQRVAFGHIADGYDSWNDVADLSLLDEI